MQRFMYPYAESVRAILSRYSPTKTSALISTTTTYTLAPPFLADGSLGWSSEWLIVIVILGICAFVAIVAAFIWCCRRYKWLQRIKWALFDRHPVQETQRFDAEGNIAQLQGNQPSYCPLPENLTSGNVGETSSLLQTTQQRDVTALSMDDITALSMDDVTALSMDDITALSMDDVTALSMDDVTALGMDRLDASESSTDEDARADPIEPAYCRSQLSTWGIQSVYPRVFQYRHVLREATLRLKCSR
ncbi:uncharacterized protein LOC127857573 [Dreissena polymorpha]|uniref:Uncharacterized protein n=1 Tax=Dreissena polymorpha TaxID=45954 RepID=A0A9D4HCR7_DREPO|nr:uncharacterized protein LOC127857573 [Dreissena polymorpha]XP_052249997.1 uncharacterized protein LOC127857573 [Dreissena polymorpha]XP_052249998.1 uncharacterized protein LOC127857573 [Dreissena polymorpha]XP_052249999.1 uncharacterized protein LOC127857573 [Dreissena polymorpha]KAH3712965.1 hypothetical protein DPMN_072727 [Dreissena polymorpha]